MGAASTDRREMSLSDWMKYYEGSDQDGLLTMSVEFSRSTLEKCLQLPEIVSLIISV